MFTFNEPKVQIGLTPHVNARPDKHHVSLVEQHGHIVFVKRNGDQVMHGMVVDKPNLLITPKELTVEDMFRQVAFLGLGYPASIEVNVGGFRRVYANGKSQPLLVEKMH